MLNSDAHIDGVAVTGADELAGPDVSGVQRNHAILATSHDAAHGGTGAHTVEIENSTVSGFQKTGIFVNGSTLTANIHDNTIVGTHTANTAQNGIQVGSLFGVVGDGDFSGTHATIDHNTITDIGNSGPAGSASGIIVFSRRCQHRIHHQQHPDRLGRPAGQRQQRHHLCRFQRRRRHRQYDLRLRRRAQRA